MAAVDSSEKNDNKGDKEEKKDQAALEVAAAKAQANLDALVEADKTAVDMYKVKKRLLKEALTAAKEALAKMKALKEAKQ